MHALLLLAVAALAQPADDDQAALLTDDLQFAENLARHRYFDLAIEVAASTRTEVERLPDSRDLQGEADLTEARILKRRAENTVDPVERLEALDSAIGKLRDWTGPGSVYAYHDRLVDALEDMAELLRVRGQMYGVMAAEGDNDAVDKADADFRAAEETYRAMRDEAEALSEQYLELEEEDKATTLATRAINTWYFQGLNSIEWADVAEDSELRLEQATKQLDNFTWDADDEQLVYWYATFEQARAYDKLGETDDAMDVLLSILDIGGQMYWDYVQELPEGHQGLVAALFDKVWGYLAELESRNGDLAAAEGWIDTLRSEHDTKGVRIGREGFAVLLDWARSLDGLGRTGSATELVKLVADVGKGTPEGQIAEVMLTELVAGGNVESPAVLMSAARGSFTEKAYADAAFYYERAAALMGSEELAEMGIDAWMGAGSSLRQLSRHLESALAYEQALLVARDTAAGLDVLEKAATGLYNAWERRYKETGDEYDKNKRVEVSEMLIAMEGIELDLAFMTATEAFGELQEGDVPAHLAVKADFEGVPASSPNYERALVYIARALAGAGRLEEAIAGFETMEARVDDPSLEPTNATSRNRREIALAQSRYFHASLLVDDRVDRPADALLVLAGYETDVPGQESFHDLVKLRRIEAHAALGDVDAAEGELAVLSSQESPAPTVVAAAAYVTGTALEDAARAEEDVSARNDLLGRAADALWQYAEADGFSSPVNVMGAGDWYLEVGRSQDAERVFARALDVLQRSGGTSDRIERARIGLATSLDEQKDFGRSRTLWKELQQANPNSVKIRRGAARCYGGWLEIALDGTVTEIGGSGDYQDAIEIWTQLVKGTSVKAKYTELWWESKLSSIYCYYRMRNLEPEKGKQARLLMDNQKLSQPNFDADTMEHLEEEQKYEPLFRDAFRYLDRQIPTT
jgi:tetratricopeptide (TPR) repeat protein